MKLRKLAAALALSYGSFFSCTAAASHLTVFAPIDAIDHVFGPGGGSFTTTLASGSDDAWLVFDAAAGDLLSITATGAFGTNVVLFREASNGVVEIGDRYTLTGEFDGNNLQTGTGLDLVVQDMNFHPCGDCYVAPGSDTFTVSISGQYVIGLSAANEFESFVGPTTITLIGNTAVSEPATLVLLGMSLVAFGLMRVRSAA